MKRILLAALVGSVLTGCGVTHAPVAAVAPLSRANAQAVAPTADVPDRKSTRLNSSHT